MRGLSEAKVSWKIICISRRSGFELTGVQAGQEPAPEDDEGTSPTPIRKILNPNVRDFGTLTIQGRWSAEMGLKLTSMQGMKENRATYCAEGKNLFKRVSEDMRKSYTIMRHSGFSSGKNGLWAFSQATVVTGPCPGQRTVSSGRLRIFVRLFSSAPGYAFGAPPWE